MYGGASTRLTRVAVLSRRYNPGVQSRRTRDFFAKSEANRSFSNAITDSLQAKMALPAMSVSEFTNPSLGSQESSEDGSQFIKSSAGAKHWETMSMIFSKAPCRNRNLYFGASSLMRTVTDLRSLIIRGRGCDIQKRLDELESDCTATSFALPPWFFNPTRNLGIAETDEEHQNRLNALLVWSG